MRTSVCVKGEEIELIEMVDGLLRFWKFELERVRVRDMERRAELDILLNAEPPESEGRCVFPPGRVAPLEPGRCVRLTVLVRGTSREFPAAGRESSLFRETMDGPECWRM